MQTAVRVDLARRDAGERAGNAAFAGRTLLFVVNEAYFILSHRLAVARAAQRAGFAVHIAAPIHHAWAPADFDLAELRREGFAFHPIQLQRRTINPLTEARTFLSLLRLYRRLRPDVIHHLTIKPNLYGGWAARIAAVPAVVYAVTGLGQAFARGGGVGAVLRALLTRGLGVSFRHPNSFIVFQNIEDRDQLTRLGVAIATRTVVMRGSGVDLVRFRPQPDPDGLPTVVLASRMIWEKGIGEFVEAARALKAEGIGARFALVGGTHSSNPRAVPEKVLRSWAQENLVEWWGYRQDMADVLAGSSVVCLPTSYGEGVPKILLEAAACGRPVVASDIPGCREAVESGVTGLLVPPGDVGRLAEALKALIQSRALRLAMGAAGRRRAEAAFDEADIAAQTLAVYSWLLAADSSGIVSGEIDGRATA